jgi:hypothetical protein
VIRFCNLTNFPFSTKDSVLLDFYRFTKPREVEGEAGEKSGSLY